ncbi:MAG: type IV toxin-antitoxin system AbiEi family antitoxin domain-containing protein [Candidatus Wallbacteria bacterium]|nr:type IV toxin-antitoxin system AbiEi family antitoxin domain-containing protein [Candidatus Wallbacteria bacterium]
MKIPNTDFKLEVSAFKASKGMLTTGEAKQQGISIYTLKRMTSCGLIIRLGRGFYRLAELPPLENSDLTLVSLRAPEAVICLISALDFHHLTTRIPHYIYLAVERGRNRPRISYPRTRIFQFAGKSFSEGIEKHQFDNQLVRIYSVEKTLADCFKYRNKIGMDVILEALKNYRQSKKFNVEKVLYYADLCRVESVISPYLETLL